MQQFALNELFKHTFENIVSIYYFVIFNIVYNSTEYEDMVQDNKFISVFFYFLFFYFFNFESFFLYFYYFKLKVLL